MLLSGVVAAMPANAGVRRVDIRTNDRFTGRGNGNELLLDIRVVADGRAVKRGERLHSMTLTTEGTTNQDDIARMRILASPTADGPYVELASWVPRSETYVVRVDTPMADTLYMRVTADIAQSAAEGDIIAARLVSIRSDKHQYAPQSPQAVREILLARKLLYAPGDYGSRNWRIPALCALPDGSLLAVNDKRKFNEGDLPQDIDIVARRSTDNGLTWSQPVTIAEGTGFKKGFGDPALAVTADGSEVVCVFVGGNGLWDSTPDDPQRSYVSRSADGGATWSEPDDITPLMWGAGADNAQCREYTHSFFGSGNGLTLKGGDHAGRILFAAAMGAGRKLNNHAVYSDDNGRTWHVSDMAFENGDEAKIVELTDGRLLMSVRRSGQRGYALSSDGGHTWENQGLWPEMTTNACNGDMIRYPSADGTLLLHSIPNDMQRRNVSIFMSRDEGRTWSSPKVVCPYESVYSSLAVLADGTVGIFLEENPTPAGCELWYMNFSAEWLAGDE